MDINIYKFDKDLQIVELGKGNLDKINELLEESLSNSNKTYEHGEDTIAATSFGISKTNKDFIEIGCHGDNEITIHTDRLFYGSKWSKIFSPKQHLFIKATKLTTG